MSAAAAPDMLVEALVEGALRSPDAQLAASLGKMARGAADLRGRAQPPTLAEWWRISPLISFMEDVEPALRRQPLEDDLLRWLGHLENVCQAPQRLLRSQTERVPVSRARRVSPHAASFLSAHPEDWEARTLRGVRPRRVLSLLPEDELDLYENRVAARLIDHLLRHLRRRLEQLAVLTNYYDQYHQLEQGWHFRQTRVYALWGGDLEEQQHRAAAQELRETLTALCLRLQHLQDSALYRAIPRSAAVGRALRVTNILAHDPEYRYVVRLWHSMRRARAEETPSQRRQRLRQLGDDFRGYAQVLVLRALHNLGVVRDDQLALRLGERAEAIATCYGLVALQQEAGGALRLSRAADGPGGAALRILPCPAALAADAQGWQAQVAAAQQALGIAPDPGQAPPQAAEPLVVLYPAPSARQWGALPPRAQGRLAWQGDGLWLAGEAWRPIPVSPLQLDSVERVARVLLGWLLAPLLLRDSREAWQRCPVCAARALRKVEVGQECTSCQTRWGSHRCSACGERFAFLRPGASGLAGAPARIDYVDAQLGRDALALPCPGGAEPPVFVCPRCGRCPRREQRRASCVRCQVNAAAQLEVQG